MVLAKGSLWPVLVLLCSAICPLWSRRYSQGPSVDPGVFVITHIQSCRHGAGYCILGFSCDIDRDFVDDDQGGHCNGLEAAFSPSTSFVCCRENPNRLGFDSGPDAIGNIIEATSTSTSTTTSTASTSAASVTQTPTITVTETMTEIETEAFTETVTREEAVTEILSRTTIDHSEPLYPGVVLDDFPSAMELLQAFDLLEAIRQKDEDEDEEELISTTPTASLQPDRDDEDWAKPMLAAEHSSAKTSLHALLEEDQPDTITTPAESETTTSMTTNGADQTTTDQALNLQFNDNSCGQLGGSAVLQAFGRAAHNLLPDLVASWVTGNAGGLQKRARLDVSGLEPRIIAGDVTSTVLYCWMAAIVEHVDDSKRVCCTGTLVKEDLIVTSAACTLRVLQKGTDRFRVILGDSNLNIDLPFGVQTHEISQALVHEKYSADDQFHHNDIGIIKLKTQARLENTICIMCLPENQIHYVDSNCTVVGYGLGEDTESDHTIDGILRKADLAVLDSKVCESLVPEPGQTGVSVLDDGFICAGGQGDEESCQVAMDGGSPLTCLIHGRYELAGLVTNGRSCPRDKKPSLFTNVSKHSHWIRQNYYGSGNQS